MLLALQTASKDRQHEAKVMAGTDNSPNYRLPFTVDLFSTKYGPYVSNLLHKDSTLNLHGIITIAEGNNDSDDDEGDSSEEEEDSTHIISSKPMMSMMQQLMAEQRGEPVVTEQRPAPKKERKKKEKKVEEHDGIEEEDLEIFSPYYDDESRVVKICKWYPADGLHRRPLEELLNIVHFAALARDDPHRRLTSSRGGQESNDDNDDDAEAEEVETSTKLQRLIAGYTTQNLCELWEEARRNIEDNSNNSEPFAPWNKRRGGKEQQDELRAVVAENLTAPWCPPPSEGLVNKVVSKLAAVVTTPLAVPSLSLLQKRWAVEMEQGYNTSGSGGPTTATSVSFFPTADVEGMAQLGRHGEVLRWKLIRSIVDGTLLATLVNHIQRLDQRMKKLFTLKKDPTLSSQEQEVLAKKTTTSPPQIIIPHNVPGEGKIDGDKLQSVTFPSSLVGYFPTEEGFKSSLTLLRSVSHLKGDEDTSSCVVNGEASTCSSALLSAMFWDLVLFDLERTSRR